jgi:dedicator of cytokinesis protein 3
LLELSALASTIARIKTASVPKPRENQDLGEYILATLTVLRSPLNNDAYPSTWLSLHIYHHSSALMILRYLDTLLTSSFLPTPEESANFDMQLWRAYLETLLRLVASPSLTLESFPEQKRRAVWKISGDIRQTGADLLRTSWETLGWDTTIDDLRRYNIRKLGGFQVQYVPSLVPPIMELCLSMHEGLRRVAVEILQTMIVSEWALNEDLEPIETEIIGSLNNVLKAKKVNANEAMAHKLWVGELLDLFATIANQPDDALWTALEDLVATVEELIDLLTGTEGEEVLLKSEAEGEMEKARKSIDGVSSGREGREYGTHALECYKQLAEEYERNGDYKRLAKTYRAIARIHEARAASRLGGTSTSLGVNGHADDAYEHEDDE